MIKTEIGLDESLYLLVAPQLASGPLDRELLRELERRLGALPLRPVFPRFHLAVCCERKAKLG